MRSRVRPRISKTSKERRKKPRKISKFDDFFYSWVAVITFIGIGVSIMVILIRTYLFRIESEYFEIQNPGFTFFVGLAFLSVGIWVYIDLELDFLKIRYIIKKIRKKTKRKEKNSKRSKQELSKDKLEIQLGTQFPL